MSVIALRNVQKSFGALDILTDVNFQIGKNERAAIIGKNGTGKTTIMKMIAGKLKIDDGMLAVKKDLKIGYLEQIPDYKDNHSVGDILASAFSYLFKLKRKMRNLEKEMSDPNCPNLQSIMDKYAKVQEEFDFKEGYKIEEKIEKICQGLKIPLEFMNRSFNTLSGGEKTRTVLGKFLLEHPDILLLDEPTNHLDIDSVEWLENFLSTYEGTVLIISHDRYFLDRAVNKIIEVEYGMTREFSGNYSFYVEQKRIEHDKQMKDFVSAKKEIKKLKKAAVRFREWGRLSDDPKHFARAKRCEEKIEELKQIRKPSSDKTMKLHFNGNGRSAEEAVKLQGTTKSFNSKTILQDADMLVKWQNNTSVLGKNGSGKTTILKMLLGLEEPDYGIAKLGSRVRPGYLAQEITFPKPELTVLEYIREKIIVHEGEARNILAKFLFFGDDVFKKIEFLSGGEKVRLKLCELIHEDINMLILDEPTNHLDIPAREAIEEAIEDFYGTILFISHDRYFIRKFADKIVEIRNKKIYSYDGNYEFYKEERAREREKTALAEEIRKENHKKRYVNQKLKKNKTSKNKFKIQKIEKEIEKMEKKISELDKQMYSWTGKYEELSHMYNDKKKMEYDLDILLGKWTELQEEAENSH